MQTGEIEDTYYHFVYYDDNKKWRDGCGTSVPDSDSIFYFKLNSSEGHKGLINELIKIANLQNPLFFLVMIKNKE